MLLLLLNIIDNHFHILLRIRKCAISTLPSIKALELAILAKHFAACNLYLLYKRRNSNMRRYSHKHMYVVRHTSYAQESNTIMLAESMNIGIQ